MSDVGIVLFQNTGGQAEHFAGADLKPSLVKPANHVPSQLFLHAIRFQQNKGGFHKRDKLRNRGTVKRKF